MKYIYYILVNFKKEIYDIFEINEALTNAGFKLIEG